MFWAITFDHFHLVETTVESKCSQSALIDWATVTGGLKCDNFKATCIYFCNISNKKKINTPEHHDFPFRQKNLSLVIRILQHRKFIYGKITRYSFCCFLLCAKWLEEDDTIWLMSGITTKYPHYVCQLQIKLLLIHYLVYIIIKLQVFIFW